MALVKQIEKEMSWVQVPVNVLSGNNIICPPKVIVATAAPKAEVATGLTQNDPSEDKESPSGQNSHSATASFLFVVLEGSQVKQSDILDDPIFGFRNPAPQTVQLVDDANALYLPVAHNAHVATGVLAHEPTGHAMHTSFEIEPKFGL